MFTIHIKNLHASTVLGVYEREKHKKRPVILNIALEITDTKAGDSDDFRDAVDYDRLEKAVVARLEDGVYGLIEKLVTDIGTFILSHDTRIAKVRIEADKPGALQHADSVSVVREFQP